jgi:hypothetical protein
MVPLLLAAAAMLWHLPLLQPQGCRDKAACATLKLLGQAGQRGFNPAMLMVLALAGLFADTGCLSSAAGRGAAAPTAAVLRHMLLPDVRSRRRCRCCCCSISINPKAALG